MTFRISRRPAGRTFPLVAATVVAGAFALAAPAPAAAETYATCAGFIEQLPVTITKQGVWCLRGDLATNIASGVAIAVGVNNVTIDCNGFKLGGLSAGAGSYATGVHAHAKNNVTVRGCNLRGFSYGVSLDGSGHLVEDNRFVGSLQTAIYVSGTDNLVRRNIITDTGGLAWGADGHAIHAAADIVENRIDGVTGEGEGRAAIGIVATAAGTVVRGNSVRGLVPGAGGNGMGLVAGQSGIRIEDNHLIGNAGSGNGLVGPGGDTFCLHNSVRGFTVPAVGCGTSIGNAF
jgi:hypothetical protein